MVAPARLRQALGLSLCAVRAILRSLTSHHRSRVTTALRARIRFSRAAYVDVAPYHARSDCVTRSCVHPRTQERSLHDHRIGLDCRADASYGLKGGHGMDATVRANDHRYLPDVYDMAFIVRTSLSQQRRSRLRVLRLRCAWHHRHCSLRRLTRGGAQLELARHVVHSTRQLSRTQAGHGAVRWDGSASYCMYAARVFGRTGVAACQAQQPSGAHQIRVSGWHAPPTPRLR